MKYEVLLVDDSEDMIELMTLYFNSEKSNLSVARNGIEALDKLNSQKWPDLILLDYNMDKMNGVKFLEEVEKTMPLLFQKVPIIMMTANEPKDVPKNKANEIYHKRGDLTQIINIIKKYLPNRI